MSGISVDKNTIYRVDNYCYKNFVSLTEDEKRMVFEWRNHASIREMMINNDEFSYESHLAYLGSLVSFDDKYYWMVYNDDVPVGVVYLLDIEKNTNIADFGYYYRPDFQNKGDGLAFVYGTLKFFFQLGVDKLRSSVNSKNSKAIVIDKYFGSKFDEANVFELNGEKYIPFVLQKSVFEKKFK